MVAGDGWLGDRVYRWERAGEPVDRGVTEWVTRWRTEEDASDFEYAYARSMTERFPQSEVRDLEGGGCELEAGTGLVMRLVRSGTEVVARIAPRQPQATPTPQTGAPSG